jgi:hypothetical protein
LVVAALAWFGWFLIAPAFGFPTVRPAAMINRVFLPDSDPQAWLGWVVLTIGLLVLGTLYYVAVARQRGHIPSGLLFGAAAWFITGLVLMPIMGWISGPVPESTSSMVQTMPDAMPATLMMLHLGTLAPLEALVAWLLFGAALGAASELRGLRR